MTFAAFYFEPRSHFGSGESPSPALCGGTTTAKAPVTNTSKGLFPLYPQRCPLARRVPVSQPGIGKRIIRPFILLASLAHFPPLAHYLHLENVRLPTGTRVFSLSGRPRVGSRVFFVFLFFFSVPCRCFGVGSFARAFLCLRSPDACSPLPSPISPAIGPVGTNQAAETVEPQSHNARGGRGRLWPTMPWPKLSLEEKQPFSVHLRLCFSFSPPVLKASLWAVCEKCFHSGASMLAFLMTALRTLVEVKVPVGHLLRSVEGSCAKLCKMYILYVVLYLLLHETYRKHLFLHDYGPFKHKIHTIIDDLGIKFN